MDCYRLRNSSDVFSDLLVARIVTVVSSARTPRCVVTTPVAMLHVAVPPERLGATCIYGAYVRPMLIHVRLLEAMSGPCSIHVDTKEHAVFGLCRDHVGRIQSLCSAYVDPC